MRVSDGVSDVELSGAVPYKAPLDEHVFEPEFTQTFQPMEEQVWRGVLG
jgi:hypothetical protein